MLGWQTSAQPPSLRNFAKSRDRPAKIRCDWSARCVAVPNSPVVSAPPELRRARFGALDYRPADHPALSSKYLHGFPALERFAAAVVVPKHGGSARGCDSIHRREPWRLPPPLAPSSLGFGAGFGWLRKADSPWPPTPARRSTQFLALGYAGSSSRFAAAIASPRAVCKARLSARKSST